jgi:hypothetical protein
VKSIIAVFLIVLQLALQVGIPIHKHFCEMDGAFSSVLIKVDHECTEPHQALPPCCQKQKEAACAANLQEKDCCSDELQVVKTNYDQAYSSFDWESVDPVACFVQTVSNFVFFKVVQEEQSFDQGQQYRPPPLYASGRDLQVKQQVWRI